MDSGNVNGLHVTRTCLPTPTCSDMNPAFRRGGFSSLGEALRYGSNADTGLNFYNSRGILVSSISYSDLYRLSLSVGRKLLDLGFPRGSRICLIAETGISFISFFFGCQYAGYVPCPVPYNTALGGREAWLDRISQMMRAADASALICPDVGFDDIRNASLSREVGCILPYGFFSDMPESDRDLHPLGADEIAYIQYSSGSTSAPKGVRISQRCIMSNATSILRHGLDIRRSDRAFSWLPFYHDMGLVGFLLAPLLSLTSVDYISPMSFARRPGLWLRLISDNRCTISFSPSFGYETVSRRVKETDLDLSCWRVAGIGGDMVRWSTLDLFHSTFSPFGFRSTSFLPCYGMAESTLAISFPALESPPSVDYIDRARMTQDSRAVCVDMDDSHSGRYFVSCGRALPAHEIEIRDDGGSIVSDCVIGHVFVRGPSVMDGYYNNAQESSVILDESGWLNTGDMGYIRDGELYITGRSKDLILCRGRNIWPQDIEWAVENTGIISHGDIAAFSSDALGEDHIIVLVQCRVRDAEDRLAFYSHIRSVVGRVSGVECDIRLVAPRSLPLTSSGKLSRMGARDRYLSGEITEYPLEFADGVSSDGFRVHIPSLVSNSAL